ncbi:hypothetical protein [Lysobacter hankyongensis]|uniref:NACHT domain-containing protein n=1 Tax=Lysobacter hankyongensis TaxID=1176535 RepID=UPI0031E7360E
MALVDEQLSGLFVEFFGGLLLVIFMAIFFGLPKRIYLNLRAFFRARVLEKRLAQGSFDSGVIVRAVKYYVRPMCSNVDPSIEDEPLYALSKVREPLFQLLDRFLKYRDSKEKHLLLLADSGMGKTSFFINYLNYKSGYFSNCSIRLISLSQPDCDYLISRIPLEERPFVDIFLDALDEDAAAYGRLRERMEEILSITSSFRSVVISCRTQFFTKDDEIPEGTGLFKLAPVSAGESKTYRFQRIYLSPFDDNQVKEYINKRYPGWMRWGSRARAYAVVKKVPALSVRPMLLAHISEIIGAEDKLLNSVGVYAAMVDAWLRRESWWVSPEVLRLFSRALAVDYHVGRAERGLESASPEEIDRLARSWNFDLDLSHLTSRSLLNRTSDGRYKFAHRSIMEYLVIDALFSGKSLGNCQLTDQMIFFLVERLGLPSELSNLFYGKSVVIDCLRPKTVLGYATDYYLFRGITCDLVESVFMSVRLKKYMSSNTVVSLGEALAHMAGQANYLSAGGVRETVLRLSFRRAAGVTVVFCYSTVWLRNAAIMVEMLLDEFDFSEKCYELFSLCETSELMVSIDGLGQRKAVVSIRNGISFPQIMIPGVSFSAGESSDIKIFVHEEHLFPRECPLAYFGVLGSVSYSPMDNAAGYLLSPRGNPGDGAHKSIN